MCIFSVCYIYMYVCASAVELMLLICSLLLFIKAASFTCVVHAPYCILNPHFVLEKLQDFTRPDPSVASLFLLKIYGLLLSK